MGKVYEAIDDRIHAFLLAQKIFFVATAPSGSDGHVNVSPKGLSGCFAVLDPLKVAYLEYGGSGIETIAHLRDNGRIVLMFCAFDGPPKIYRLHGRGREVLWDDPQFPELMRNFPEPKHWGARSVIVVDVERVSDSCGYGVPLMDYTGDRDLLNQFWDNKDEEQRLHYLHTRNATSIDGVPVLAAD
ncbi:pyridoxamine 5'-phosphate oxidase family protein [Catelliglobosispora koreensis]|uniref:pyridoxamine 5'-phosphate oxidase family protein n=1 Tax=Catelliglobosispora koreensis TaxID=129052 RepID=UPI00036EC097|nr:pyridoxamine 5'-phosphate oxidase family protein [Catelliglobosispora koreensis]